MKSRRKQKRDIFNFKEFKILQKTAAMKVGTDGLLLAASTPIPKNCNHILDIGAGSGLISLVLAQRNSEASITAIEIDSETALECEFNFNNAKFKDRLQIIQSSLAEFASRSEQKFDLIISNPPFYKGKIEDQQRDLARNLSALPPADLLNFSSEMLKANGQLSLIYPYEMEAEVIAIAKENGLLAFDVLRIKGNLKSKISRSIMHFKKSNQEGLIKENELIIEPNERHQYSKEYRDLLKNFLTIFE